MLLVCFKVCYYNCTKRHKECADTVLPGLQLNQSALDEEIFAAVPVYPPSRTAYQFGCANPVSRFVAMTSVYGVVVNLFRYGRKQG